MERSASVAMVETYKEFTFEAAHQLQPFSGLHGHTFRVRVHFRGSPDAVFGWPANLYEVEPRISSVQKVLDHTYLNDIDGLAVPSLENIAKWIWDNLAPHSPQIDRITVSRGPDGQAEGCTYSKSL
ncbi:6-carboxytetrahydropterin synthase [Mesorhizobium sp. M1312]|uniref:6-carboxytetrahydropterin synthase n=1 Tax=unclassified Mesorhizobium TaxID=325217 RepID=UPI00333D8089